MWAIASLTILAGLIVLVLCVPLDLTFRVDARKKLKFKITLTWLFGLISKEAGEKKAGPKERMVEIRQRARDRKRKARESFRVLRTKGLVRQLVRLLKDVFRRLKVTDLAVQCKIGLGDPADTGFLYGLIGPVIFFLRPFFWHQIRVQPVFGPEPVFEGHSYMTVRMWPIRLVLPLTRFVFSLPTMKAVKVLLLNKWRRKK